MARTRGCLGVVSVGATPSVVGELRGYDADESVEVVNASVTGSCGADFEPTLTSTTGQITVWFDAADAGQLAMVAPGTKLDIIYQPGGTGSGLPQEKIVNALITNRQVAFEVAGLVEITFSFQGGPVDKTAQAA